MSTKSLIGLVGLTLASLQAGAWPSAGSNDYRVTAAQNRAEFAAGGDRQILCSNKRGDSYLGGTFIIEINSRNELTHAAIDGGAIYGLVLTDPINLKVFSVNEQMLNLVYSDQVSHTKVSLVYDWASDTGMGSITLNPNTSGANLSIPMGVNVSAEINCKVQLSPQYEGG